MNFHIDSGRVALPAARGAGRLDPPGGACAEGLLGADDLGEPAADGERALGARDAGGTVGTAAAPGEIGKEGKRKKLEDGGNAEHHAAGELLPREPGGPGAREQKQQRHRPFEKLLAEQAKDNAGAPRVCVQSDFAKS